MSKAMVSLFPNHQRGRQQPMEGFEWFSASGHGHAALVPVACCTLFSPAHSPTHSSLSLFFSPPSSARHSTCPSLDIPPIPPLPLPLSPHPTSPRTSPTPASLSLFTLLTPLCPHTLILFTLLTPLPIHSNSTSPPTNPTNPTTTTTTEHHSTSQRLRRGVSTLDRATRPQCRILLPGISRLSIAQRPLRPQPILPQPPPQLPPPPPLLWLPPPQPHQEPYQDLQPSHRPTFTPDPPPLPPASLRAMFGLIPTPTRTFWPSTLALT
ncbi:hypothetical protein B0O80DRAFT_195154 [Mortierella sp. GBAus27b]|nr:hypothetical protein B0O80DRAFT_195154 [Mortierella sp. GBAus27b]